MQGGLPRDMSPFYYRDLLHAICLRAPGIHIHAYSPMEVSYGVELTGLLMEGYLSMLREAGLNSLQARPRKFWTTRSATSFPKQGERGAVDQGHHHGSPPGHSNDIDHDVRPQRKRHTLGSPHAPSQERFSRRPEDSRSLFLCLGASEHGALSPGLGPVGLLRRNICPHALARVLLNDAIPNIQVSWVKMGRRMSQLCLRAGANDFGGTLMEESISRLAGSTEGQMMWPYEFRDLIRQIGRVPAERSTTYKILRRWGWRLAAPACDQEAAG
jgi:hypothetical protein